MKIAAFLVLAVAGACLAEDGRPKRSLFAYPAAYSGAAYYGAPFVAPVVAPPLSPVVARASTVFGQPGFVARNGYYGYPYGYPYGYWPGSAAVYIR